MAATREATSSADGSAGIRAAVAERVAHDLDERPVRDALAVREAPSAQDRRVGVDLAERLLDQPGLPHPGRTEHGEQVAHAVCGHLLERLAELAELAASADERGVHPARGAGGAGVDADQAVGGDGVGLALHRERLDRLQDRGVADQARGRIGDQHVAGRGALFQAGGHVDGVPGDQRLARGGVAGDHLAGVDTDPALERGAVVALELLVQQAETFSHTVGGADGPDRVVFVGSGDPEHGHHGVADKLLHGAAMPLDGVGHGVEVAHHHASERLGVQALAERGRAGDVAEDDGDGLAHLGGGRCLGEPLAARVAEPGPLGVLDAARRAVSHRRTSVVGERFPPSPGRRGRPGRGAEPVELLRSRPFRLIPLVGALAAVRRVARGARPPHRVGASRGTHLSAGGQAYATQPPTREIFPGKNLCAGR
jgi:hypothetical protein